MNIDKKVTYTLNENEVRAALMKYLKFVTGLTPGENIGAVESCEPVMKTIEPPPGGTYGSHDVSTKVFKGMRIVICPKP